ncbi:DNA polymerase-3 subunit gamma/tau [Olsenella profusa DSM 13989]|uniref:DNA polymerase III subunit gamma/tau n=1 Tax=Olsenella profusa TaxID=138595 RepID=UPI002788E1E4|nr:DNA polymerase III subunit gamma/tau [Olsenella profusa]MDP9858903.1 DNA polymerase-3 subunit gamma/tau [Olsenella profusa DSM 13989]
MESLYRTYRPQRFEDVIGQQHVVSTLEHAVLEGRTSHAYLFCGPRGTGKTTMARLLAKALMCEQGAGHLPDGSCENCRLIAAGEHPDVYELDAASRTGVDNVREEIINRVSYAPVRGNYKVYIIDEVHMLTTAAFNALLKTLEEPPDHVVFVLCTTDPQKVPATILSRVQRFDFHAIGNDEILAHLKQVCEREGFTFDEAALDLVVRHARGGMRDALSTLEQLSTFGGGDVSLQAARDLLGEVSGSTLATMACALAQRDVPTLFATVGELVDGGRDLLHLSRELAAHLRDVYVASVVGDGTASVLDLGAEEGRRLRDEALAFGSPDRISRALIVLSDASSEMRTAPNQRLVLEVALTRIARPKADLTLESLADRVAQLERSLAPATAPHGAGAAPAAPATRPVPPAQSTPARQPAPEPIPEPAPPASQSDLVPRPTPTPAPTPQPVPSSAPTRKQRPDPTASGVTGAVSDPGELQRRWKQVVDGLVHRDPPRGSLLLSAIALDDDGTTLQVGLPRGSTFAAKMLEKDDVRSAVGTAIEEVFGTRAVRYVEASDAATHASVPAVGTAPAPAPDVPPQPVSAPSAPSEAHPEPASEEGPVAPWEPEPASQPASPSDSASTSQAETVPPSAPDPKPEPTSSSAPETAPTAEGQSSELGDILDMLTDVFGDGVTVKSDQGPQG